MGFNYAKEKEKFDRTWAMLCQQYEAAGMSQDAIKELYDFDWNWFKSRRRYFNWLADLPESMSVEDLPQEGTEMTLGDSPAHYGAGTATERYWWIEEVGDSELLQKLMLLCADDIEVLTCLVFEECTQEETARRLGRKQQAVSRQFLKIRKIFEKGE